jgi:5-oxoprolinase (ATP-hydrolysing) subunit A
VTGPATVDLNADLGEGFGVWQLGDDEALLDIVSSANVACGFHAGDPTRLLQVCRMAAQRGVRIGAQVSYRDLAGFGRRYIDMAAPDLTADVIYQIGALQALAQAAGSAVSYIKPHGALYNTIVTDRVQARAVVAAVRAVDTGLPVLGLPGSVFLTEATQSGLPTVCEVFADRAYQADGALVPRTQADAVLHDPALIAERVSRMVRTRTVHSADGADVAVTPESICVHGDSPSAVQIAAAVRRRLHEDGIEIRSFC